MLDKTSHMIYNNLTVLVLIIDGWCAMINALVRYVDNESKDWVVGVVDSICGDTALVCVTGLNKSFPDVVCYIRKKLSELFF